MHAHPTNAAERPALPKDQADVLCSIYHWEFVGYPPPPLADDVARKLPPEVRSPGPPRPMLQGVPHYLIAAELGIDVAIVLATLSILERKGLVELQRDYRDIGGRWQLPSGRTVVSELPRPRPAGSFEAIVLVVDSPLGREPFKTIAAKENAFDFVHYVQSVKPTGTLCRLTGDGIAIVERIRSTGENGEPTDATLPRHTRRKRAGRRRSATDSPDAQGFVKSPSDPSGYVSAKDILAQHAEGVCTTHKQLLAILEKHPEIKRWRPRANRLSVHLADWQRFVKSRTNPTSADGWSDHPADVEAAKAGIRRSKSKAGE